MTDPVDTATESVERLAKVFDGDEPGRFGDRVGSTLRALAKLHEPIADTYACQKCGRRDGFDCVVPNHIWNQIESETGFSVLCAWCLDAECHSRGIEVRALLAFVGRAIYAGTDPRNVDPHWERHLGDLTSRCSQALDDERKAVAERDALLAVARAARQASYGLHAIIPGGKLAIEALYEALDSLPPGTLDQSED